MESLVVKLEFTTTHLLLFLGDGREVKVPLTFYPRLENASIEELNNYRLIGEGSGVHWEDLDEDLSVESIVLGRKAYNAK